MVKRQIQTDTYVTYTILTANYEEKSLSNWPLVISLTPLKWVEFQNSPLNAV